MTWITGVGIVLAITVDIILPLWLVSRWTRANFRGRVSNKREGLFWMFSVLYLLWVGLFVARALAGSFQYDGSTTIAAVFVSLPMSAIPAIFNSNVIHFFFTQTEWADFGYLIVIAVFLVGLVIWALVLPLAARRFLQQDSDRQPAAEFR